MKHQAIIRLKQLCMAITMLMAFQGTAHDLRMARFDIIDTPAGYELVIRMDRLNLLYTLQEECLEFEGRDYTKMNQWIAHYIQDNFRIKVDGRNISYQLDCVEYEEDYVILQGNLEASIPDFAKMNVWNTCLVRTIPKHSNLIRIKTKGTSRTFRLHVDRQSAVIEYQT